MKGNTLLRTYGDCKLIKTADGKQKKIKKKTGALVKAYDASVNTGDIVTDMKEHQSCQCAPKCR